MHRVVHFCVCSGMAVSITRYVLSSAVCWEGSDAAEVLCFLKYVGFFFFLSASMYASRLIYFSIRHSTDTDFCK